jgi:hypothetical protein
MPSFWSGGLHQGTPVTWKSRVEGPELVLTVTGLEVCAGGSVQTTCEVRLGPPDGGALTCAVSAVTAGVVPLDARPGEAFKPVMLSSMHIADEQWDAQTAYIGCRRVPLPASGWIASTSERTTTFGLLGGTSAWKVRAPSVRVSLAQPLVVTGWVTATQDPNDDNVGLWAAADQVLGAWMYRVVVGRSTELGCGYLPLSRGAIAGS